MSIRSSPRPCSTEVPSSRILEVVHRSLETALTRQCAQRYDAHVVLRRLSEPSDNPSEMPLRLDCQGLSQLSARIVATHVGDHIYDVRCVLNDKASRRFSYGLSRKSGRGLSPAPELGRKLASFLLDELEKRLGRHLLQRSVCFPNPSSPPSV